MQETNLNPAVSKEMSLKRVSACWAGCVSAVQQRNLIITDGENRVALVSAQMGQKIIKKHGSPVDETHYATALSSFETIVRGAEAENRVTYVINGSSGNSGPVAAFVRCSHIELSYKPVSRIPVSPFLPLQPQAAA